MIDRGRMTERLNLQLMRLELKRAFGPLLMLALGFAAAIAAGDYILTNINGGVGSTHTMRFEVADATGVVPGRAEVRVYGIEAGEITNAQLVHGHAVLTATVANRFGPIYKNADAEVRPNTALQDMYLDIVNPGTPGAGVADANYLVPMSQTQSPVNLADVLNTFQPDVRTQLYNLLDQLGNGLQDRGQDLRRAFALLAPFLRIAGNAAQQIALRSALTKQLVHNASVLTATLASRSTQLHQLITSGTTTLEALSSQDGQPLRQTIAGLPAMLHSVGTVFTAAARLLPLANRAATVLTPVADDLPSGLSNLKSLALSADPAVRRLQAPVTKLVPLAHQLQPLASNLASSLRYISPQVQDVDTVAADAASCEPWMNEFFNWDASFGDFVDNLGPLVRGNVNFGFYSVPTVKQTNYTDGYQCAGGQTKGAVPTPKYDGPPPMP